MQRGYPVGETAKLVDRKVRRSETLMLEATGRYVTCFSPEETALHFASIEIFGKPEEGG
jgi:hypothetical protein